MPSRRSRKATLLVAAVLSLVAVVLGSGSAAHGERRDGATYARSLAGRVTVLQQDRLARAPSDWRGGQIATSTGETVTVFVSNAIPPEQATPEGWAEFLAKLVHGPEISRLELYIAPLAEIRELCGSGALGCYSRDHAVALGETVTDGTTAEEVVRHEYGHHIALYRSNAPWRAIDWGPKRWASAANVCARVKRREAFPGDEGQNYAQNPGEGWAEVYRLMDEQRAGILTARWQVVAPSFYPSEAALQAAEQDVLQPWSAGQRSVYRRAFRKKGQVWWIRLSTPLDGSLAITATVPRGGQYDVALVGANRRTVIARAATAAPRRRSLVREVCGARSLFVRVTQKGTLGQVTVAASTP